MNKVFNVDNMNGKSTDEAAKFDFTEMNHGKCEGSVCDINDINCSSSNTSKHCIITDQNCCAESGDDECSCGKS